jgi:hypothetical protein
MHVPSVLAATHHRQTLAVKIARLTCPCLISIIQQLSTRNSTVLDDKDTASRRKKKNLPVPTAATSKVKSLGSGMLATAVYPVELENCLFVHSIAIMHTHGRHL